MFEATVSHSNKASKDENEDNKTASSTFNNKIVIKIKRSSIPTCSANDDSQQERTSSFEICKKTLREEDETIKLRDNEETKAPQVNYDQYCWNCHLENDLVHCKTCQRQFHLKCLLSHLDVDVKDMSHPEWSCFECNVKYFFIL